MGPASSRSMAVSAPEPAPEPAQDPATTVTLGTMSTASPLKNKAPMDSELKEENKRLRETLINLKMTKHSMQVFYIQEANDYKDKIKSLTEKLTMKDVGQDYKQDHDEIATTRKDNDDMSKNLTDVETELKREKELRMAAEREAAKAKREFIDAESRLMESKELMLLCRDALKGARGKKELYTRLNMALGCEADDVD